MAEQYSGGGVVQDADGQWLYHWHDSNGDCFTPSGSDQSLCQWGCDVRPVKTDG